MPKRSRYMPETLTLGSLFDGSGGFPLGGIINGIKPVWASEIEPFPIMVTTKRLPSMEHIGDISSVNGGEITPVDIITFGSPCQDMSIAGRRDGLSGSRSGLFYQAVRIIKEMREETDGRYPRYIVWENVTGAFSSNKGEDFRAVLEEIVRVKEAEADIPRYEKWPPAGQILADNISVAWRVFDAQYWGVPQRRKRIYLVADLNGGSAGKILFESEGMSGYSAEGFSAWQGAAGGASEGTGKTGCICLNDQGGSRMDVTENMTCTLRAEAHHPPVALEHHPTDSRIKITENGKSQTLTSRMGTGGNNVPLIMAYGIDRAAFNQGRNAKYDFSVESEKEPPLVARGPGAVAEPIWSASKASFFTSAAEEVAGALVATDYKDPPLVNDPSGCEYIVRRLTPTECARLQGFPDWWCSDLGTEQPAADEIHFWADVFETHRKIVTHASKHKTESQIIRWLKDPHSDSAEYKMWGNGIALPNALFVLAGIVWADSLQTEPDCGMNDEIQSQEA